jgi:hypothetical protein
MLAKVKLQSSVGFKKDAHFEAKDGSRQ